MTTPLVILGCGFLGTRIARAALAEGRPVRACARSTGKLAALAAAGAEVKFVDASVPKQLTSILASSHGATVVYAIPPVSTLPPGVAMRAALQAAYGGGASCFIYFSSTGLYGAAPDDDAWIDEDTPRATDDGPMHNVIADEDEVRGCSFERLRTVILRIAPVYGGGRGVRARMRKGDYRIIDDGQHVTSRIHVDDLVRVVFAAEAHAPRHACYLVADDEPTTQGAYAQWLSTHLGVPMPPSRALHDPGGPRTHRNRKIRNARMKAELGVTLAYPTFREGEAQIDAEEASAG
jgi:nucleoside-diphosphate-sugar epimerase